MNFSALWLKLFHTTTFLGIDMGFWVSMFLSFLIALLMNLIFWNTKPYHHE